MMHWLSLRGCRVINERLKPDDSKGELIYSLSGSYCISHVMNECTVAEKCKTNHDSENKTTSQKTQRQIRQTGKGRYSLRQRHWFGNR